MAQEASDPAGAGITAVEGLRLGHFTLAERPTGCTVVLAEDGAVAGVDVRGGAPGTREVALLDPVNRAQEVHAVVLSGGSAFGLDAASGVVRYLEEKGIGYEVAGHVVPIVPAAILFDLGVGMDPSGRDRSAATGPRWRPARLRPPRAASVRGRGPPWASCGGSSGR